MTKFQDLNFPPLSKQQQSPPTRLEYPSLDLKLDSLSSASPSSSNYQSVCTLDKVKSALARAEKETKRKRSRSLSKSCSSPRSNSSSSIKDSDLDQEEKSFSTPVAAGCPRCLMYVLIPKSQPRCPRCNTDIPLPVSSKKPRIDLNISI